MGKKLMMLFGFIGVAGISAGTSVLITKYAIPSDVINGKDGMQGPDGKKGVKGDTGEQGTPGPAGADSTVAGPQGIKGEKGDTGPQGLPGKDGADSTVAGPQGVKGEKGDIGPQGIQGEKGDPADILVGYIVDVTLNVTVGALSTTGLPTSVYVPLASLQGKNLNDKFFTVPIELSDPGLAPNPVVPLMSIKEVLFDGRNQFTQKDAATSIETFDYTWTIHEVR